VNILSALALLLLWLAPAVAMLYAARQLVQFAQLASYQLGGYVRAVRRLPGRCAWPGLALGVAGLLLLFFSSLTQRLHPVLSLLAALLFCGLLLVCGYVIGLMAYREKQVKVRLVRTPRVKRLYGALLLVGLLLTWAMYALKLPFGASALLPLLLPLWLLLALVLAWPLEKAIQLLYRADASRVLDGLRQGGLRVIGITGSYGKTTVKNILQAMLRDTYPTLASPASFNTPLGLARCIRGELGPQHRFFIAEMGARHPQDIRVLARMIRPELGILTAIGPQHLQTLGNVKKVGETKYALIRALPEDGFALFNDDGGPVRAWYEKTAKPKALAGSPGSAAWAEDLSLSTTGSSFTLCFADGAREAVSTRLSGEHNVRNILLAAAMARHLGVSPRRIAEAAGQMQPVASRLQTYHHPKGYLVINNGFNSNPDSSRKALEVLSGHPGRLVVVTPGFIELGRQEASSNRRLGNDIAAVAHTAILVGEKHTRPIREGLLESGMSPDNIHVFRSLAEANRFIEEVFGPGDVLLYENDLPDHYG